MTIARVDQIARFWLPGKIRLYCIFSQKQSQAINPTSRSIIPRVRARSILAEMASGMELRDDPRLRQILDEAADLPPSDRPDFLAKSCGNNVELRGEIEGWLKSLGEASRFLKEPTRERKAAVTSIPQSTAGSASPRGIARQIGPYKLL